MEREKKKMKAKELSYPWDDNEAVHGRLDYALSRNYKLTSEY